MGKSGPKTRPNGVVDGQQVDIPALDMDRTCGDTGNKGVPGEKPGRSMARDTGEMPVEECAV